jgi:hypothetical protein
VSIDFEHDLPTGYDRQYSGDILTQGEELKRNSLINIWPAAGGRKAVAIVISESALDVSIPIINGYLDAVGLDPIEGDIREVMRGKSPRRRSRSQRKNCASLQDEDTSHRLVSLSCLSKGGKVAQPYRCRVSGATGANASTLTHPEWNRNSRSNYKAIR